MEGPEYFQPGFCSQFATEKRQPSDNNNTNNNANNNKTAAAADHFIVEDLLDFSNDDDVFFTDNHTTPSSTDSSTLTLLDSANSSSFNANFQPNLPYHSFADANFSSDLCVPVIPLSASLFFLFSFVEQN